MSFTRHFCKSQPLRSLEEISADILAIEQEAEGLLDGVRDGTLNLRVEGSIPSWLTT